MTVLINSLIILELLIHFSSTDDDGFFDEKCLDEESSKFDTYDWVIDDHVLVTLLTTFLITSFGSRSLLSFSMETISSTLILVAWLSLFKLVLLKFDSWWWIDGVRRHSLTTIALIVKMMTWQIICNGLVLFEKLILTDELVTKWWGWNKKDEGSQ